MTGAMGRNEDVQAQLARLSPERRALVERLLRERARQQEGIPRRTDPTTAPLSAMQRFLWLLTEANPGLFAYNAPRAFELRGDLDVDALQVALDGLVARHEIFRTRIQMSGDEAFQRIDPPRGVQIVQHEVAPDISQESLDARLGAQARLPFDLSGDLLLRADLFRLGPTRHQLLLVSHHFASDGWSRNVMFRELGELYDAARAGRASALPPVTLQYGDYAAWQESRASDARVQRELDYWRTTLADAPAMLDLPVDKPRPAAPGFGGLRQTILIPQALVAQLEQLALDHGASLFMLLLSAHATLLRRYTGQADLVIGIPVAGRTHPDLEGIIGYLGNSLPVRVQVEDDPSFVELVDRVRRSCLEAYDHQEVPFEVLALEVSRDRPGNHAPVFQSLFTLHDHAPVALSFGGLEVQPIAFETGWTKLDLVLDAAKQPDGSMQVTMAVRDDLFEHATLGRMLSHVRTLLESIAERPEQRVSELRLLPEGERRRLLEEWNRDAAPTNPWPTLHEAILAQARRTPDAIALEWEDPAGQLQRMSFEVLIERATHLAGRLQQHGVAVGTGVGVCAERSPELVIGMLGALLAGAHYVPFDPAYPVERLGYMVRDAGVPIMLVHAPTRDVARSSLVDAGSGAVLLDIDDAMSDHGETTLPCRATATDLAYVIYTSGSTGRPKGVMIPHGAVANYLAWMGRAYPLTVDDAVLQKAPASFDACIWEFFLPLVTGARLVLARPGGHQDPDYLLAAIERHRVTILQLVPVQLRMLFELDRSRTASALATLRHLFLGGEALPADLLSTLRSLCSTLATTNLYGPTEATVYATAWDVPPGAWSASAVPIGRPIEGATVHVVDGARRPVPIGVRGELCIGGVGLARGYHQQPELTAERFVPDPFSTVPGARMYRTGDLARWTGDGLLQYAGRLDEQVKLRGHRIELGEVEAVLGAIAGVTQSVVVLRDTTDGPQLVGYYVAGVEGASRRTDLFDELRRSLPPYMVPAHLVAMASLPVTPSGKVDRKALPDPDPTAADVRPYVAPRTTLETTIAEVWSSVLGQAQVGIDDNFFALGGHSLLAMRVIARLAERLSIRPTMSQIFESPTVAALADRLAQLGNGEQSSCAGREALSRRADRTTAPLAPAQQRFWIGEQLDAGHAGLNVHAAIRLAGHPTPEELAKAIRALTRHHEALRTAIVTDGGIPRQQTAEQAPIDFAVTDLRSADAAAVKETLRAINDRERTHEFDLARAPLARFHLVQAPAESVLHLVMHHLISDGWAVRILLTDLATLLRGEALEQQPDRVDYGDYAEWMHSAERQAALEEDAKYWRRVMFEAPPLLELPTDRPRSATRGSRGARRTAWIPPAEAAAARAMAEREGATLFMVLMATFQTLLARLAGQDDVVVGMPVTGRSSAEEERMVGCFINTIPLRVSLAGAPAFREIVRRVRTATAEGLEHQALPFDRMVRELQPERSLSHTPLFQVMLNMMTFPRAGAATAGSLIEMQDDAAVSAKFDLTLYVSDRGADGIRLVAAYDAGLFDDARIAEMLRQLIQLLGQAVAAPDEAGTSRSLVTEAARLNLPDPTLPLDASWVGSVHELLSQQAASHPARIAVIDQHGSWSYGDVDNAAARIAGTLRSMGVQPGDVVALHADRSASLVPALVGILRAGAAFLILDAAYPGNRLGEYVRQSKARSLVMLSSAGALPIELQHLAGGALVIPATSAEFSRGAIGSAEPLPLASVGPDSLAYISFTSGTSGRPKGIRGRHGSLTHFSPWRMATFGLDSDDRFSMLSGLSHDPLHRDLFLPLQIGAAICVPPVGALLEGRRLGRWMAESGITVAHLTPAMTQVIAEAGLTVEALRWVFFVGEALGWGDVARLRQFAPNVQVVNQYGATESQQALGYHQVPLPERGAPRPADEALVLPAGKGVPGVQLLVLDREGHLAGIGELGEIGIRSPHLALGYLDPALDHGRFEPNAMRQVAEDRWYRTGDLGRFLPDGTVVLAGRADDQLKLRGFRVEPGEIAAVLRMRPGVKDAVVLPHDPYGAGPELVGFLVSETVALDLDAIRAELRAQLPEYMVPAQLMTVAALPLTPNGKLDRRRLLAVALEAPRGQVMAEPAETPVEAALLILWRAALRRPELGVMDSFFDLGGHSLLATQLVARIGQVFRRTVPLRTLFERPRIRDFAADLVSRESVPGQTAQIARLVIQVGSNGATQPSSRPAGTAVRGQA